jgi:putative Ca2+/H+ antiporter (TMEM165/GDT1 family)
MLEWLSDLWASNHALTFVGVMMVFDLAVCLVAMVFDSRQITGVNAWLKPAKFGLSSAVTCLSLAWIAGYLRDWPGIRDWSGRVFALSIAIEIFVIDLQAARGTTSHFNMATPFDRVAFITMGISIGILWLSMVGMMYALMRQKLQPVSWAWALRLGLLLSVVGAAGGGFMLRQTPEQEQNPELKQFGAHTVGAPDGGPGLPVLNWSENHGDLRVAHFIGLHAMQIIPLIGWWLLRKKRLSEQQRTRLIWLASGMYVSTFALLAWQALRGQALLQPDEKTLIAASLLVLFAAIGSWLALSSTDFSDLKRWAEVLEVHS